MAHGLRKPKPVNALQAGRRELARRLVFLNDLLRRGVFLRCDMKGSGTDEDPYAPLIAARPRSRSPGLVAEWASRQHPTPDGGMVVYVAGKVALPSPLPPGVEKLEVKTGFLTAKRLEELRRLAEKGRQSILCEEGLEFGDYDKWVKPKATKAGGHFSIAHPDLWTGTATNPYPFTTAYDPLSNDPAFPVITNDNLRAVSGKCYAQAGVGAEGRYRWQTDVQPPDDCSVQYVFTRGAGWSKPRSFALARQTDANNYYEMEKNYSNLLLFKMVTGSRVQLATAGDTGSSGTVRLQMVGDALKTYRDGVEKSSVANGQLMAGYAGCGVRRGDLRDNPAVDNLAIYADAAAAGIAVLRRRIEGY